jgi:multimeric flavodoxin WrbA
MSHTDVSRRSFFVQAAPAAAAVAAGASILGGEARAADDGAAGGIVLGISCSPRKGKGTATSVGICLEAVKQAAPALTTELIDLGGLNINGCVAAGVELPAGQHDDFLAIGERMIDPAVRGIIIGTPVYFGNMSYLCKALLDRCHAFHKEKKLGGKVAGVLATGGARNGGIELTIRSVQVSLMSMQTVVVGDAPPTSHWGGTVWAGAGPDVSADEFGMSTVRNLGKSVAAMVMLLLKARA